jgi:hypothetical protein
MLEMRTKWFTNSLAKQSMLNKDFILCHDGTRLFIVGYGAITSGGKNTYNYEVKDNEKNIVLSSGENAYLDALTKIILGTSPKSKATKETNESEVNKPKKQTKEANKEKNECLYLTFDKAFDKACKMIENYKEVAIMLGKYSQNDASLLALHLIKEASESEKQRIKDAKKSEELKSLRQTLELAKAQGNNMLVDAIQEMIANKEKE